MYHFTECDLNIKSVALLKDVYSQIGCTIEVADKRVKANWVQAILRHQSAQIELVAVAEIKASEQATAQTELETHIETQAETIAPEITTVEIDFFTHEIYALGKQIASITHDPDDFQTQRWVVMVGETEVHRAAEWAKCHNYICWHYKQGTLPAASQSSKFEKQTVHTFYKEVGAWRITTDTAYFEKLAELNSLYPLGELVGDIHDSEQRFVAYVPVQEQSVAQSELNEVIVAQSQTVALLIEIDSAVDPDFGALYRVWNSRTLLGTFYQSVDEKWVAQPCDSDDRPKCNTAGVAQLLIVANAGLLVADTRSDSDDVVDLLDKPFDELTVEEWKRIKLQSADLQQKLELAYTNSNFGCYNRAGAEVKGNEFLHKERRRVASGELVMVCCDIAGLGRRNSEIGEVAVNNAIATSLKEIQSWRGVHFISQLNSGDEFVFIVDRVDAAGIVKRMDSLFKNAGFEGIYGAVEPIDDDYIKSANDGMELVYKLKQFAKAL